jgi:hypothetical protein
MGTIVKITNYEKIDLVAICVIVPIIIFITANLVNDINETVGVRTIADAGQEIQEIAR